MQPDVLPMTENDLGDSIKGNQLRGDDMSNVETMRKDLDDLNDALNEFSESVTQAVTKGMEDVSDLKSGLFVVRMTLMNLIVDLGVSEKMAKELRELAAIDPENAASAKFLKLANDLEGITAD